MSVDCGTGLRRQVVPCQPAAQPVEIGKQHPLVDVRLIELVADFPFERLRDRDAPAEAGMALEPVVHACRRTRHEREQRELIQDAAIDGRGLEKYEKGVASQRVEVFERPKRIQHVDGDRVRALAPHDSTKV